MRVLPTGIVTFLFTDVEGSTRRVIELGAVWREVVERHDALMKTVVEEHEGTVIRIEGDSVFAAFAVPSDGVSAAVAAQQALAAASWPGGEPLLVRMGLHTGRGVLGGSDYIGIDVHRAARVSSSAHGGQIVISEATAPLAEAHLPPGCELLDLGKHRLKDLSEAETLFQVVIPGMRHDFPPLHTLDLVHHNLPVQVTSFVGRTREIAEARRLLATNRILTLLGPGGTGKTRLALQVAAEASGDFPDGVYFVSLAEVADHRLIASTVLDALSVAPGAVEPGERLQRLLATKSVLLVMDNFEHLIEGATIVTDIVRSSPGSKVLVTSRIPLRVSGEQEMAIDPLEMSDSGAVDPAALERVDAIHLFLERAAAVQPGFALTAENAATVADLVRRLDGLPLAIELVAPRLRLLSVEAVLERLDLAKLGGGSRDLPERHRTLWNAVAWSEETLTPAQRNLFCLLAVFAGGGGLPEIEAVARACDPDLDVLEGLAALVESSLLRRAGTGGDRFEMLVVIREYASDRLDESGRRQTIESAHAAAYLALAEEAERHLLGPDRKRWLEALTIDHDNLRAATAFFVSAGLTDEALRMGWALWRFWQIRGHIYEGRRQIDVVLALPGGEPRWRAKGIEASGGIAWWEGDLPRANRDYAAALSLQRQLGDPAELANALYNSGLGQSFGSQVGDGDPTLGREAMSEAEQIYRHLGDRRGLGDVNWGWGNIAHFSDNDTAAGLERFTAAIDDYAAAGSVFGEGWARYEVGSTLLSLGRIDEAEVSLRRGLELLYGSGDESAVVLFVVTFAAVALNRGDTWRSYVLAGAAWALRDRSGLDIISIPQIEMAGLTLAAMEALTGDDAAAYQEGRRLSTAQAVALAIQPRPER